MAWPVLVFDLETLPDMAGWRRLNGVPEGLAPDCSDTELHAHWQASRAAQALVEQGLVRKQDSADDGRGVVLSLTPAGRKACQRTMALIEQRNQEMFGCLDAGEQTLLSTLLDRLIAHARKR